MDAGAGVQEEPMDRQKKIVVAAAALMGLAGCHSTKYAAHEYAGQRVVAQYSGRTLFAELPSSVRVAAVIAAADENFRSHGYTVLDKDSTEEEGRCVAHAPGKDITRVVVRSKRGGHGTEVTVVYEPFGEEELSRYHFDGILQHLSK
jgi:hypothetical protein